MNVREFFTPLPWAVAVAVLCATIGTQRAEADDRKGTYGGHGYQTFAQYDDNAFLSVTSDHCNSFELGAYRRILNTTQDKNWLQNRWPSGINFDRDYSHPCDGEVTKYVDIKLNYQGNFSSTHGDYGGENHSNPAPSSWCEFRYAKYPCGYHISTVHLNKDRLSQGESYFERLIIHETGHSLGLAHHCSSDSIMNDGYASCNNGLWGALQGYTSTDREGIHDTYPGWKYN